MVGPTGYLPIKLFVLWCRLKYHPCSSSSQLPKIVPIVPHCIPCSEEEGEYFPEDHNNTTVDMVSLLTNSTFNATAVWRPHENLDNSSKSHTIEKLITLHVNLFLSKLKKRLK